GHQPEVPTSGKRKGYKVFGAIEYFSGRLFSQGIEGRFNSDSYQAFLQTIMAHTTAHLFLIHDGARYHTSASTTPFLAAHHDRITEHTLPSYSPDYNPIAYLWKKTKQRATHNKAISQKEYPSSWCRSWTDQNIPLGQLGMAFQAALDRLHGFFAQC